MMEENQKLYLMETQTKMPMLIPMEPEEFWKMVRMIIGEELDRQQKKTSLHYLPSETPGLTYKPLYKITEVCSFLQVSRPTIYDWIHQGMLKPYKIKSRVYFLYQDIIEILKVR